MSVPDLCKGTLNELKREDKKNLEVQKIWGCTFSSPGEFETSEAVNCVLQENALNPES